MPSPISVAQFDTFVRNLERSATLGLFFNNYLYKFNRQVYNTTTTFNALVAAATRLSAQELSYINTKVKPYYSTLTTIPGSTTSTLLTGIRDYDPAYFANTVKLFREAAAFIAVLDGYRAGATTTPSTTVFLIQYGAVTNNKFVVADEDEYKKYSEFLRLLKKAQPEIRNTITLIP